MPSDVANPMASILPTVFAPCVSIFPVIFIANSKAIAEAKKQGGKNVSFSELRKELGL
jgi:hypothetical protein